MSLNKRFVFDYMRQHPKCAYPSGIDSVSRNRALRLFVIRFGFIQCLGLIGGAAFAQSQYVFSNYTQEHGLPSGTLRGIYKDTTGYIWLTSEGGVARFDGYDFKIFRHNPDVDSSLPNNWAWSGSFPSYGDIYFLIEERFNVLYQPASETFTLSMPFGDTINEFIVAGSTGTKDNYWAYSESAIFKIDHSGTARFSLPISIKIKEWKALASPGNDLMLFKDLDKQPLCLFFDSHSKKVSELKIIDRNGLKETAGIVDVVFMAGEFHLFTRKSVFRFDRASGTFLWINDLQVSGNPYDNFPPVLPLDDKRVMMRSSKGFLRIVNIITGTEKRVYVNSKITEAEIKDRMIHPLVADHRGGVWMGTTEMGIIHYDISTGEIQQFIHEYGNTNSLPGNFIEHVLADENGVIWAASPANGLVKMEPVDPLFEIASPSATPNSKRLVGGFSNIIRGFLETDHGYWIATLNGLFSYSKLTKEFSDIHHLFQADPFYNNVSGAAYPYGSLARDQKKNVWIGTWSGDLYIYQPQLQKPYTVGIPPELKALDTYGSFRNLFCDSKNRMWISTHGAGIWMTDCNQLDFDNLDEIRYTTHLSDTDDSTTITRGIAFVVTEDADNQIWAGTEKGLSRYNEHTQNWKRYSHIPGNPNSLRDNNIRALCLDEQKTLWIGTNEGGLSRYNKEQDNFTHFTTNDGLVNDQVYSLVCDDNGMLWLGTNKGLCRFNPQDYTSRNFSLKDGIQDYEFNTGAAIKLKDGTLLFGGVAGYNIIDPDEIENKESTPPSVVITSLKIFEKEIPPGNGPLKLRHTENSLAFGFAALSYFNNHQNQYAYKLEGIEDDWIYSGTRRYVSYSKLQPGDYTFRVKASNVDGVWNETGAQLHIVISPPWWRTWWAYCLYAVFAMMVLFVILSFFKRRVLLQQQLKSEHDEAIRLKELDTFKSRLFTNLTHEFRTPLTVILGMTRQLAGGGWQSSVSDKEKEKISTSLKMIENNGRNLLQLINQLLDLSKLENKSFRLQSIQSDIIPYLRYISESFQSYAEDLGLVLHFTSTKEGLVMDFDPEQIKQILTNLISNGLKFTPPGGEVNINVTTTSGLLQITVSDTGIGIAAKDLPYIMDRFYQADSSTTRAAEGTGIGLAHTQELLKVMGGNIVVESQLGKGTTVTVRIPITHLQELTNMADVNAPFKSYISLPSVKSHATDLNTLNGNPVLENAEGIPQLLIIEDSRDVVEYLRSCLEHKYQIQVAFNGKEGVEKALEQIPDFIISDVMMPEMDGYEVCDTLKNDDRTSHIPLILLTAKADAASRLSGLRRGADAYIAKPFDPEELHVQISMLLDNRQRMATHFSKVLQNGKLTEQPIQVSEDIIIEDVFMKKVNAIIEAHYNDEQFALPELCRVIGMSRSQLFRKLKAVADVSPSDLIRSHRLRKAKSLLEYGEMTVAEVTYQVGFKDPSYFSKMFQEEFGVQPSTLSTR